VSTKGSRSYRRSNDVRDAIAVLGAKRTFIKPHCPWQNGKIERFNRARQIEWASCRSSSPTTTEQPPLHRGSSSTTLDGATPH
jgi:transposase InsO family protein